jgi:hypothetical protein
MKALHLLERLSSHPLGVHLLVHRHVPFCPSNDTLLVSLVLLPKGVLMLTTDGLKAGAELFDNQRQPVVLLPYLPGLFLVLAGTVEDFHQLLPCLLGVGYGFLVADAEVRQFTTEANRPLLGLGT